MFVKDAIIDSMSCVESRNCTYRYIVSNSIDILFRTAALVTDSVFDYGELQDCLYIKKNFFLTSWKYC